MSIHADDLNQAIALSQITYQQELDLEIAIADSTLPRVVYADDYDLEAIAVSERNYFQTHIQEDVKVEFEFKSAEDWWAAAGKILINNHADLLDIPIKVDVLNGMPYYSIVCPICKRRAQLQMDHSRILGGFRHAEFVSVDEQTYRRIAKSSMEDFFDPQSDAFNLMIPYSGCAAPFTPYLDNTGQLKVMFGLD